MSAVRDATHAPGGTLELVTLLPEGGRRWRSVLQPDGVMPMPVRESDGTEVLAFGTTLVDAEPYTWAWGVTGPHRATPGVRFRSRWSPRGRTTRARRLSATVWAAQLPGRWVRVTCVPDPRPIRTRR